MTQGENSVPMALSGRTARASVWAIGGRLVGKAIDLVSFLVLTALLTPLDIGLVAMAMTTVLIVEALLDLPVSIALISVRAPSQAMFDTAFTLGTCRGLLIALILAVVAWPLAGFYSEERLALIMCVLGLAPIMRGLASPRMIIFAQQLDFRWDFLLDVSAKSCSFIATVIAAVLFQNYWSVIVAIVVTPTVAMLLSYWIAPMRPRLSLGEWHRFSTMLGWSSLAQAISALNWQLDRVLLPRFISVTSFGHYTVANDLSAVPHQALGQPLMRPLLATFSAVDTGPDLQSAFCKACAGYVTFMGPIFLFLGLLAQPLTDLILSKQWSDTGPILRWLAFTHILTLPAYLLFPLALRLNLTRFLAIRTAIEFAVKLPLMIIGIVYGGITGALVAYTITSIAVFVVCAFSVRSMIGLAITRYIMTFARPCLGLCAVFVTFRLIEHVMPLSVPGSAHHLAGLVIICIAAAMAYAFTIVVAWFLAGRPAGLEALAFRKLQTLSRATN